MEGQSASSKKILEKRLHIAEKMIAFEKATDGHRQRAESVSTPRTTLYDWRSRKEMIPLPKEIVSFFESPIGVEFLHRIITATFFCMIQIGGCGIRVVQLFLELSQLKYFVASSYGILQKQNVELEKAILSFEEEEKQRLSEAMPSTSITVAQDETFHPMPCLVAIEPISNFIICEQYSDKRDTASWNEAMRTSLSGLNVTIKQSTSDEGKSILSHVQSHLGAHHSPDIFHVQQDITKATCAPLTSKINSAQKAVELLEKELIGRQAIEGVTTKIGRPSSLSDKTVEELVHEKQVAKERLNAAEKQKEMVREAKKGIGDIYHPFNLETGHACTEQNLQDGLNKHFLAIEKSAHESGLRESSLSRIAKAKRVCTQLIATLTFFWMMVHQIVESLALPEELEKLLYEIIIPAQYLMRASKKAKSSEQRYKIAGKANELLSKLENNSLWVSLDESEKNHLRNIATECANWFQRSSSCVEGRNGYLSLRHHGLHHLSERKLTALIIIHNYYIERPDGTTPAERFFHKKPKKLFDHLVQKVDFLPKPRKVGIKNEGLSMVA